MMPASKKTSNNMTADLLNAPAPFVGSTKKDIVDIYFFDKKSFGTWLKKQNKTINTQIEQNGFECGAGQVYDIKTSKMETQAIICGIASPAYYLDSAVAANFIAQKFSKKFINSHVFKIDSTHDGEELNKLYIGWGLAAYKFDTYKAMPFNAPTLQWHGDADKTYVTAAIECAYS
jgi:leucyl aminopeptidase